MIQLLLSESDMRETTSSEHHMASQWISQVCHILIPLTIINTNAWFAHLAVKNSTLTLRDRDTRCQRIGSIDEVVSAVASLCDGTSSWEDICERLPEYTGQQDV